VITEIFFVFSFPFPCGTALVFYLIFEYSLSYIFLGSNLQSYEQCNMLDSRVYLCFICKGCIPITLLMGLIQKCLHMLSLQLLFVSFYEILLQPNFNQIMLGDFNRKHNHMFCHLVDDE
jgi:hypothetical protein